MNVQTHLEPNNLTRYAFYWSLARMVIAAFSLFFGATPVLYKVAGYSSGFGSLLPLAWIISGAASLYLLYVWYKNGQKVFGGKNQKDTIIFFFMVITGLNLGYTAIGTNIGMSFIWDVAVADIIFKVTGIVYLLVGYYLFKRWRENNEHIV